MAKTDQVSGRDLVRVLDNVVRRALAQAFGHDTHHVQRKHGRFMDEKKEAAFIDRSQRAVSFGDDVGAAGGIVDQRHFAQQFAWPHCANVVAVDQDIDLPGDNYIHVLALIPFAEDCLACGIMLLVLCILK